MPHFPFVWEVGQVVTQALPIQVLPTWEVPQHPDSTPTQLSPLPLSYVS